MREVVLGSGAKIWRLIAQEPGIAARFLNALRHKDLASFAFTPEDRVWVFAYSTEPSENSAMLERLKAAGVAEIVYISSSSTIVSSRTNCYAYPRAKKLAEDQAQALPNGKVVTLGLVVEREDELPAGDNAAVTIAEIAAFMLNPVWSVEQGKRAHLLRVVRRPFGGGLERGLHGLYAGLMGVFSTHPCLLRPLDLVLRTLGMRWYGYTFLSNRLWCEALSRTPAQA